jgi:hypothetical protein
MQDQTQDLRLFKPARQRQDYNVASTFSYVIIRMKKILLAAARDGQHTLLWFVPLYKKSQTYAQKCYEGAPVSLIFVRFEAKRKRAAHPTGCAGFAIKNISVRSETKTSRIFPFRLGTEN